jgi:hypothetical protein
MSHFSKKSMHPKANEQRKKKTICEIFHQKKIQKVLMKIEEMADVFLNSANFASHAFLTLAPPSDYALNLKALIKVSNISTSQLSYERLRSSFERKFDKTNFISPKRTPPKSPHRLGLMSGLSVTMMTVDILILIGNFRLKNQFIGLMQLFASLSLPQQNQGRIYFLISLILSWMVSQFGVIATGVSPDSIGLKTKVLVTVAVLSFSIIQSSQLIGKAVEGLSTGLLLHDFLPNWMIFFHLSCT